MRVCGVGGGRGWGWGQATAWVVPSAGVLEVDVVCFDDPDEVCVCVRARARVCGRAHRAISTAPRLPHLVCGKALRAGGAVVVAVVVVVQSQRNIATLQVQCSRD